ncbi:MAG: cupin domain-containing protein [Longimicrobiales bacterium]|nr:cupin domain-containing protein [Longimicrobiales bacterium]
MSTIVDEAVSAPAALAALVQVQPGAVVSRTLLRNPGGTLTLFAFDAGQGLSEHSTPHDASVLVLEGVARVSIAGAGHTVPAGQILHLPAGVPHALEAPEAFKMLLVMLRTAV